MKKLYFVNVYKRTYNESAESTYVLKIFYFLPKVHRGSYVVSVRKNEYIIGHSP